MEEKELMEMAKEAYVLAQQIEGMEEAMNKGEKAVSGYPSYAKDFNLILQETKKILEIDKTILKTISHLNPYDPNKKLGYRADFEGIKADLPILKAALRSFFELYFPKKEKERIGFK
jgi:hypothetical protein